MYYEILLYFKKFVKLKEDVLNVEFNYIIVDFKF